MAKKICRRVLSLSLISALCLMFYNTREIIRMVKSESYIEKSNEDQEGRQQKDLRVDFDFHLVDDNNRLDVKAEERQKKSEFDLSLDIDDSKSGRKSLAEPTKNNLKDFEKLTLFTTWPEMSTKIDVHRVVRKNWRQILGGIRPLVFSRVDAIRERTLPDNWIVLPETEKACESHIPTLRGMFNVTMATFNSKLYGFSNSDLIFDKNFGDTLNFILSKTELLDRPILLLAKRKNIKFNVSEVYSFEKIHLLSEQGEFPAEGSTDVYITNKLFPWQQTLGLAVGRLGIGMWITAYARAMNVTIVDITATTTALHLTTFDGIKESIYHKDSMCNHELIEEAGVAAKNYRIGFIDCSEYNTFYNQHGDIDIKRKEEINPLCFSDIFFEFAEKIKTRLI